jgi:hypothetical protein
MLAFTFGHVELLTVDYHSIDTPIAELNNHTLREVFEDGNKVHDINSWKAVQSTVNVDDDKLIVIGIDVGLFPSAIKNVIANVGKNYYYRINIRVTNDTSSSLRYSLDTISNMVYISSPLKDVWYERSGIYIPTVESTTVYIRHTYSESSLDKILEAKDMQFIDLDALGISALTVSEMDTYYGMYQENISGNDVTYVPNEMDITDLTYIIGFGFIWFVIIWSIKKVVL